MAVAQRGERTQSISHQLPSNTLGSISLGREGRCEAAILDADTPIHCLTHTLVIFFNMVSFSVLYFFHHSECNVLYHKVMMSNIYIVHQLVILRQSMSVTNLEVLMLAVVFIMFPCPHASISFPLGC